METCSLAGRQQLDTLAVIAEARAVVGAERDFATRIGLRGKDPESHLTAADAAYGAADFEEAVAQSDAAVALVDDAPRLGKERIKWFSIAAGGALLLVLVLLTLLIVWLVRRRRRRKAAAASGEEEAGGDAAAEEADDAGDGGEGQEGPTPGGPDATEGPGS